MKNLLMTLLLCLCFSAVSAAQESETAIETSVYVTTQDFSSLRSGPGQNFERLSIVDPALTLPAIGRTADTRWIQVVHEGQRGWIAAILLVWSGDIITLPVDGITPAPFIRRAGAVAMTTRTAPLYEDEITPENMVAELAAGTMVELTGRLGTGRFFRYQIVYNNQLYWIGSWDVRIISGNASRLLDTAYLYPYGRLIRSFESNLAASVGIYNQAENLWQRLSRGDQVTCQPLPPFISRRITAGDVRSEFNFVPAVAALDQAITNINASIASFEDICQNPTRGLTREDVDQALALLEEAERNLILAGSLLEPIRRRNPLLDSQQ